MSKGTSSAFVKLHVNASTNTRILSMPAAEARSKQTVQISENGLGIDGGRYVLNKFG
jgi:hypothetical protein